MTNFTAPLYVSGAPVLPGGGLPLPSTNGNYWFVDSVNGSAGGNGSYSAPYASINNALLVAKSGDIIVCVPNHAETITAAAGINVNVAGVSIIGMGQLGSMPTITIGTATAASFRVSAANVLIQNVEFIGSIASLATYVDVRALNLTLQGCRFIEGAATTGLSFINLVLATANQANGLRVLGCFFYNPTAGNFNHAIGLTTVQDNIEIGGCYIDGNFALSGIHNITGKVLTNLNIHDNEVHNITAATAALNFISASTGNLYRNVFVGGDGTVASAIFNTAAMAAGLNVGYSGQLDAGQEFWVAKKGVVSSTIVTAGVAITAASIGGECTIEDVIVKTDGTGLAGGTNFDLVTNNANGAAIFFANAVSGLGANATVNMATAGVTANGRTVLELGKVVSAKATGSNCTGTGTIDIYIKFRRLVAGANVSLV